MDHFTGDNVLFIICDKNNVDVATTYLYGSIDSDIYMKIPKGFTLPEAKFSLKDLHCLKQNFQNHVVCIQ